MTVLAWRTVAFTGGSVGFGVSLAEIFCTGKEMKFDIMTVGMTYSQYLTGGAKYHDLRDI